MKHRCITNILCACVGLPPVQINLDLIIYIFVWRGFRIYWLYYYYYYYYYNYLFHVIYFLSVRRILTCCLSTKLRYLSNYILRFLLRNCVLQISLLSNRFLAAPASRHIYSKRHWLGFPFCCCSFPLRPKQSWPMESVFLVAAVLATTVALYASLSMISIFAKKLKESFRVLFHWPYTLRL